uniref:DDE Tnp4 domain-containing protein n=2 Tax=Grammatophora oceanica TaxID=210454 RepID=A0A7S1XZM0_9STRA|mmetsp:Transcript_12100/g.17746  ORF Transcript_12100/g.17746 Transcript_12100/m.17746 type:complete len:434 (+) Transcript_12100:102-1403(+)
MSYLLRIFWILLWLTLLFLPQAVGFFFYESSDDEDDDDDDQLMLNMLYAAPMMAALWWEMFGYTPRLPPIIEQRASWQEHRENLIQRNIFRPMYRMTPESFDRLIEKLGDDINVDADMAYRRTQAGPVIAEWRLAMTLRWLSGGSLWESVAWIRLHKSTFYNIVWETCGIINECGPLAFRFPQTEEEVKALSSGFESISTEGVVNCCVGVIDGWLMHTTAPTGVGNVNAYFSGHYQKYGYNVQAVVDHKCRFLYAKIAAPGGQPDINALKACSDLLDFLKGLPFGHYIIGDNAYPPREYLLPVFGGNERRARGHDDTNFFMSQCRIRSEMAFGMMTNKFGIFQRPLKKIAKHNLNKLLEAICRLHNFCIDERIYDVNGVPPHQQPFDEDNPRSTPGERVTVAEISGQSRTRARLVQRVLRLGLTRQQPIANRY